MGNSNTLVFDSTENFAFEIGEADLEFVVETRNALPKLLDEIEEAIRLLRSSYGYVKRAEYVGLTKAIVADLEAFLEKYK